LLRKALLLTALVVFSYSFVWSQAAKKPVATMPGAEERTSRYLESIRKQPSQLLNFLRAMPKGGDLHNHLSGAIYTESYIRWAAEDGLCLNRQTFAFAPAPCDPDKGIVEAKQVLADPTLYQQVINAQSMRFFNGPESGHDHFFATFGKFGAVSRSHQGDSLAEVASRAAAQNLSLLALIIAADNSESLRFPKANNITWTDDLAAMQKQMLDHGLDKVVENSRKNLDQWEARMRDVLRCGTPNADPGCNVIIRYQYEVHRGLAPEQVFAELLTGFALADQDSRVIDVNPVMPEDAYVEMHDFDLHMRMFDFLHKQYPKVHLSLHAGELWTGLVPPDGLRFHIRQSIQLGHAERIGHGVDVMFEDDAIGLLKEMAAKKIAVEINLTSNDLILGVRGDNHPLPMYMKYGVPTVLSTDDEGVSRSDMTQEYWRAMRTYNISYPQLKQMVRNSLEYSFLPGASLWSAPNKRATACVKDGPTCNKFLSSSERAKAEWNLEKQFEKFERGECCTAK
jgi:hypothetical protein